MNAECHHNHASTPSIPLPLHSGALTCLPCLQTTVRSRNLISTLRRAAATQIQALADAPDHLLRRAPHHARVLLLDLLSSLFALPAREAALAADVRLAVARLALAFDVANTRGGCPMFHLVAARVLDEVVGEGATKSLRQPLLQLADSLGAVKADGGLGREDVVEALRLLLRGRAENVVRALLHVLVSADDLYVPVTEVVCLLFEAAALEEIGCRAVVDAAAGVMPARRLAEADAFLLRVVYALSIRLQSFALEPRELEADCAALAEVVIASEASLAVLKHGLLSTDMNVRWLATRLICTLCATGGNVAEHFCSCGLFEYIVESIRCFHEKEGGHGASEMTALHFSIEAMHAIVLQNPQQLVSKWCYSLRVVLSACAYLFDNPHSERVVFIIGHAFRHAPPAVFSTDLISKFVDFEILICHSMFKNGTSEVNDENIAAEGRPLVRSAAVLDEGTCYLIELCQRYKLDVESVHCVLKLCEVTVRSHCPRQFIFVLLAELAKQSAARCAVECGPPNADRDGLRNVAQRILYVVFSLWGRALEGTLQGYDLTDQTCWSPSSLLSGMEMFTAALDSSFAACGACSTDDLEGMRAWCWMFFPPSIAFSQAFLNGDSKWTESAGNRDGDQEKRKKRAAAKRYLERICGLETDSDPANAIDISESLFLESIAGKNLQLQDVSFRLYEKALELDLVSNLCVPHRLVEALSKRLKQFDASTCNRSSALHLQIVRGICIICKRHGVNYECLGVSTEHFVCAIRNDGWQITNVEDFAVFLQIVTREVHDSATVLAWEEFESSFSTGLSTLPDPLATELLQEKRDLFRGILFAVSHSSSPDGLVDCLWDLFESRGALNDLFRYSAEVGASNIICELLNDLPGHVCPNRALLENADEDRRQLQLTRASCCIVLLIQDSTPTSFLDWSLLRQACNTFAEEVPFIADSLQHSSSCSALLRYITAHLHRSGDDEASSYVWQAGIPVLLIALLRAARGVSFFEDQLASAAACLLLLLLRRCYALIASGPLLKLLLGMLGDVSTWERLLFFTSSTAVEDCVCRAANSCHLLYFLILIPGLRRTVTTVLQSSLLSIILVQAASSYNPLLQNAAIKTLAVCMELEIFQFSEQSALCLHLQFSLFNLGQLCAPESTSINTWDVRYFAAATVCGHLDEQIQSVKQASMRWSRALSAQDASDSQKDFNNDTVGISRLMRVVEDRIANLQKKKNEPRPLGCFRSKGRNCKKPQARASDRNCAFDIVFGRHLVAWKDVDYRLDVGICQTPDTGSTK